jgi:hypothetical protein
MKDNLLLSVMSMVNWQVNRILGNKSLKCYMRIKRFLSILSKRVDGFSYNRRV